MPHQSDPACLVPADPQPVDPLAYELCASYQDPARVQPLPAGLTFDLVSVGMAIGLDALDLMLRS